MTPLGYDASARQRAKATRSSLALTAVLIVVAWSGSLAAQTDPAKSESAAEPLRAQLVEQGPAGPWSVRVDNSGTSTRRLPAFESIALELKKQTSKKVQECKLPKRSKGKRPAGPSLEAGGTLEHSFDPRWYCFHPTKSPLEPGTSVRLVWGRRTTTDWITLGPSYAMWQKAPSPAADMPVEVRVTGSDADDVRAATLSVAIKNRSADLVEVLLRHEALTLRIAGPRGNVECPAQWSLREDVDADDEAWWEMMGSEQQHGTRIKPNEQARATVRIFELCPRGTLGKPGLYRVGVELPLVAVEESDETAPSSGQLLSSRSAALVRVQNPLVLPTARRSESSNAPSQIDGPASPAEAPQPPGVAPPEPPAATVVE